MSEFEFDGDMYLVENGIFENISTEKETTSYQVEVGKYLLFGIFLHPNKIFKLKNEAYHTNSSDIKIGLLPGDTEEFLAKEQGDIEAKTFISDDYFISDDDSVNIRFGDGGINNDFFYSEEDEEKITLVNTGDEIIFVIIMVAPFNKGEEFQTTLSFNSSSSPTISGKKLNFVVDNAGLDDAGINTLLLNKVGESYTEEVNIIFGSSLRVAQTEKGVFGIKEIVGGISQGELETINSSIEEVRNLVDLDTVKSTILSDVGFMNSLKTSVAESMSLAIVTQGGDEIASSLVYDASKNAYVLDYDATLLNGVDYTIELSVN